MQNPISKRKQQAVALRDLALIVIRREGGPVSVQNCSGFVAAAKHGLRIVHRTPFSKTPEPTDYSGALGKHLGLSLPYGLDIWDGSKVLNIEWSSDGVVKVVK